MTDRRPVILAADGTLALLPEGQTLAQRKAIVLLDDGRWSQLPAGDTLVGATGGNVPAGASVLTDALGPTRLVLAETVLAQTDGTQLTVIAPETLQGQTELGILIYSAQELLGAKAEASVLTLAPPPETLTATDAALLTLTRTDAETITLTEAHVLTARTAEAQAALAEANRVSGTIFANAQVAQSGLTNPGNFIDASIATAATAVATASGVLGATATTANPSIEVDFPDFALPAGYTLQSAKLDVYSKATHDVASTVSAGSASVTHQISTNSGGAYSTAGTSTGSATAAGALYDESTTPRTFDLAGLVTSTSTINGFRYKATASINSGGTGTSNPQTTLSLYAAVLRVVMQG